MGKAKLLILQNELSTYNVPVFNIIADTYELTVGFYQKDNSNQECFFQKRHLDIVNIGKLIYVKGIYRLARKFDVVSFVPDMHVVSYCFLPFLPRKFKIVNWSIGFRVSYSHPYITSRKHVLSDRIFQSVLSHCDASIFYMDKAKEFWANTNLDMGKVFVAPNTTEALPIRINPELKRNILFVGTLYEGKGIDKLLRSYCLAVKKYGIRNELHIIGDGPERVKILNYVRTHGVEKMVVMHGAIYEEKSLALEFSKALLCVSPSQAGLSVPKSMGYAVPFVTKNTAITGGEIYHITPDDTGLLYQSDGELTRILVDAGTHPDKYIEMGIRAKNYYDHSASIEHMANGAMAAFDYVYP